MVMRMMVPVVTPALLVVRPQFAMRGLAMLMPMVPELGLIEQEKENQQEDIVQEPKALMDAMDSQQ
jgi:hypothetical protein